MRESVVDSCAGALSLRGLSFSIYAEALYAPWSARGLCYSSLGVYAEALSLRGPCGSSAIYHSVFMRKLCDLFSGLRGSSVVQYLCGSSVAPWSRGALRFIQWSARELYYSSFSIYAEALRFSGLRGGYAIYHSVVCAEALPFILWSVRELCCSVACH